jgi:S1-C subfamily serine protease
MTVDWQFIDPQRREVIAQLVTTARGVEARLTRDGLEATIVDGFRQNARALLQKQELQSLVQGNADSSGAQADGFTPLTLAGAGGPGGGGLSDAAGSVVLVQTDEGHGSGFLISGEGHLLTNAHVVGKAKIVRIRWSDGFVTVGEVLRLDRRRDVALVKTSPHSRPALALRPGLARTGEVAFAIGTPLDPKFQGTVTRGIVSAVRIYDGMSFVQSDVTVNPGNSGGPLLDDSGRVIAITDLGYQPEGIPTGINLFIPIGDALDFLNLKVTP